MSLRDFFLLGGAQQLTGAAATEVQNYPQETSLRPATLKICTLSFLNSTTFRIFHLAAAGLSPAHFDSLKILEAFFFCFTPSLVDG
jgi:hypothetical protein